MAAVIVSFETLAHFRCPTCSGWWSVADYRWLDRRASVYCPHCGAELTLRPEDVEACCRD